MTTPQPTPTGTPSVSDEEITAAIEAQDRAVLAIWGPDGVMPGAKVIDAERETMRRVLEDFASRLTPTGPAHAAKSRDWTRHIRDASDHADNLEFRVPQVRTERAKDEYRQAARRFREVADFLAGSRSAESAAPPSGRGADK